VYRIVVLFTNIKNKKENKHMNKYNVGDTIKILNGGLGAMGADGHVGVVTKKKNGNGLLDYDVGFNVEIGKLNQIWRVSIDGEYKLIKRGVNTMITKTFDSKFDFGDEVYLIKESPTEIQCAMCNGECTIDNPMTQAKIKCPCCNGKGKVILSDTKTWCVIDDLFKVTEMRIKAYSKENYYIKYSVRQALGNKYNPSEMNIFCSKELAQAECDKRNRPVKRIDLKDIQISSCFKSTMPNTDKIKECYDFYKKNNKLDRDIIIDKNNVLVDGYVGYLVCKMLSKENIRVLIA